MRYEGILPVSNSHDSAAIGLECTVFPEFCELEVSEVEVELNSYQTRPISLCVVWQQKIQLSVQPTFEKASGSCSSSKRRRVRRGKGRSRIRRGRRNFERVGMGCKFTVTDCDSELLKRYCNWWLGAAAATRIGGGWNCVGSGASL
jgi:hypothetical protein